MDDDRADRIIVLLEDIGGRLINAMIIIGGIAFVAVIIVLIVVAK